MTARGMRGPLHGIRIVEMDAIGPVPLAAMLLVDMGADILRIAPPPGSGTWDDVGGAVLRPNRDVVYLDLKSLFPLFPLAIPMRQRRGCALQVGKP